MASTAMVNYGFISVNKGQSIALPRLGYHIDSECRPAHRGRLFSMIYHSNAWLVIGAVYLALKCDVTMTLVEFLIRVAFITAVQLGFMCSDWLHSSDLMDEDETKHKQTVEEQRLDELTSLKWDMLCISLILLSSAMLWSQRLFFMGDLDILAGVSAGCVLLLIVVLWGLMKPHTLQDEYMTHYHFSLRLGQMILGVQYTMFIKFVYTALTLDDQWAHMKVCGIIWFVYFPGMLMFAIKPYMPSTKDTFWGPHEVFHFFTFAGHLSTVILDICL
eukprot:m.17423 g.17423  ORF g.17423 m.17423 type:complete len:274 (+) comp11506_c0_seq2:172-993(+)